MKEQDKIKADGERADYMRETFKSQPWLFAQMFPQQICWWYQPKNEEEQKKYLKKVNLQCKLFFKLTKCETIHGSKIAMITIDGYQPVGSKFKKGMTLMLERLEPIVLLNAFKMKEVMVFNRYGCWDYSFEEFQCIICLDAKNTRSKQNCCGKSICQKCYKAAEICCYCRQPQLTRDYPDEKEHQEWRQKIKIIQEDVKSTGQMHTKGQNGVVTIEKKAEVDKNALLNCLNALYPPQPQDLSKCGFCQKSNPSMLLCGRCKQIKYCGKECQIPHWQSHKLSCKA